MTNEQKKKLFPFFAFLYSKEINPEKYGKVESYEEWSTLIDQNKDDVDKIVNAAYELSDEEWLNVQNQYDSYAASSKEASEVESARKGTKLQYLKKLKSHKKTKKCKCGCDLIETKEDGGKLSYKCACNCSGGKMK